MATNQERPGAGDPPELGGDLETLRDLLDIEKQRLRTARLIEEKREIVFPETRVIVRDIMKIMAAIELREKGGKGGLDWLEELEMPTL